MNVKHKIEKTGASGASPDPKVQTASRFPTKQHYRVEYQLLEVDWHNFARRVLTERAKTALESILDYLAPQRILVIGFDGGQANDIGNEADLGRLKELGYQVIFKVTPKFNGYLITEVV